MSCSALYAHVVSAVAMADDHEHVVRTSASVYSVRPCPGHSSYEPRTMCKSRSAVAAVPLCLCGRGGMARTGCGAAAGLYRVGAVAAPLWPAASRCCTLGPVGGEPVSASAVDKHCTVWSTGTSGAAAGVVRPRLAPARARLPTYLAAVSLGSGDVALRRLRSARGRGDG